MRLYTEEQLFRTVEQALVIVIISGLVVGILLAFTFSSGCVTKFVKEKYQEIAPAKTTPVPIPVPTTEPERTTEYAPPSDYVPEYSLWKWENRQHNLSEWYTFRRDDVQGTKDMIVNVTVYRMKRMMNFWTWERDWGGPTDGSADWPNLPDRDMAFIFVWVCTYMDGQNQSFDPSVWGFDYDHVYLEADGQIYENRMGNMDLMATIREFENLYDIGDTVRTGPYSLDIVQDLRDGRLSAVPKSYMRMGFSNRWDGWVVFQVPTDIPLERIRVRMRFEHLAKSAYWSFKPGDVYKFPKCYADGVPCQTS